MTSAACISLHVRPLCRSDIAVIDDQACWSLPRIKMTSDCYTIVSVLPDGTVACSCGYVNPSRDDPEITALQSRVPGAGPSLLNALKARYSRLIADNVLADATAWWERKGFVLLEESTEEDEAGVVGAYEWWRDDASHFAELPYEALWSDHQRVFRRTRNEGRPPRVRG